MIGLVPQEVTIDIFATVWNTVTFSRGVFGKRADPAYLEKVLKDLSLWDKKDAKIITLSGGMKRRVMIAKALAHEPEILFLDEPSAGVDVELRQSMWATVRALRDAGTTIILTTHYIEEAEEMADRIGVINKGEIIVVEETAELTRKLGKKQLTVLLSHPIASVPEALAGYKLELGQRRLRPHLHLRHASRAHRHHAPARRPFRGRHPLPGYPDAAKLARGYLRRPGQERQPVNAIAIWTIYRFEMMRTFRTLLQSIVAPVITTSLYFIVFGSAIGSRISTVDGIDYGAFIVPGLIMLTLLTLSISNASIGIYFPKFTGTVYEVLSAPISYLEIVIAYVGAAATKSVILGLVILATASFFVSIHIDHVAVMALFMVLTAVTFCLFGFIIGLWADGFEKLSLVPLLFVTPLTFLGGTFYSIKMLPDFWQSVSLFNPVVYLVSGFRWSFFSTADVSVALSLAMTLVFLAICLAVIAWMFRTGYRLKT